MNSFETDIKRAIFSKRFVIAVLLEMIILAVSGYKGESYSISIPLLSTFPYTISLLEDYQSGYIKSYLPRTSISAYITGKILACMISGGAAVVLPAYIYTTWIKPEDELHIGLIFISGATWAIIAATLAIWTRSRYIAYGGAFVIYYLLIILQERYVKELYCLNPEEWFRKNHIWIFDDWGIVIMLSMLCLIISFIYDSVARRLIANV